MCQMFSLSATDLQYKWEALSFSSTRSINVFTMDSCAALKAKIQRDKAAEQAKHNKPPGRAPMPGNMSMMRGRMGGPPKFGPANLDGALKVGLPPVRSAAGDERRSVAGPSKVAFKGPENDEMSGRNVLVSDPVLSIRCVLISQIGTCTRKYQRKAKVCPFKIELQILC
jgi:DNA polymerase alpha subunit B